MDVFEGEGEDEPCQDDAAPKEGLQSSGEKQSNRGLPLIPFTVPGVQIEGQDERFKRAVAAAREKSRGKKELTRA